MEPELLRFERVCERCGAKFLAFRKKISRKSNGFVDLARFCPAHRFKQGGRLLPRRKPKG